MTALKLKYVHTVYHESFGAKNLRGQCITQIFTKKLSRIPIVIAISAHFSIATEIFHGKKFRGATKNCENRETFLPRNFHGIRYILQHAHCVLNATIRTLVQTQDTYYDLPVLLLLAFDETLRIKFSR